MRAYELCEQENEPDGTYAGVYLSDKTVDAIVTYCEKHKIPNAVPANKLHVTLLYSRKYLPDYEAAGKYKKPLVGKPTGFDVWGSHDEDSSSKALVLRFDCEQLEKRHNDLMDEHDAEYDYDEYNPHVTFSYDIEELDVDKLPPFTQPIEIVKEYQEELNLDWAEDNT